MLISEPGQPFRSQFVLYRTDIGLIKQTINRTSRCNKVDAVRLYASYRCRFTFTKGAEVRVTSAISSNPQWKDDMPDLPRYPWTFYLITYELELHIFCSFKLFIFICGFAAKVTCPFLAYKKQWRNYQSSTLFESEKWRYLALPLSGMPDSQRYPFKPLSDQTWGKHCRLSGLKSAEFWQFPSFFMMQRENNV